MMPCRAEQEQFIRAGAIYWILTQADRNLFSEAMADH
jgi:hypothetical protein